MSGNITQRQLEILQHALGLDKYGNGEGYRNHFCAGEDDEPICRELVALGLMVEHQRTKWLPYFNCSVTEAGTQVIAEQSPKPPKRSRSQQNYQRFLDADCGVSFGEWLKGWR